MTEQKVSGQTTNTNSGDEQPSGLPPTVGPSEAAQAYIDTTSIGIPQGFEELQWENVRPLLTEAFDTIQALVQLVVDNGDGAHLADLLATYGVPNSISLPALPTEQATGPDEPGS